MHALLSDHAIISSPYVAAGFKAAVCPTFHFSSLLKATCRICFRLVRRLFKGKAVSVRAMKMQERKKSVIQTVSGQSNKDSRCTEMTTTENSLEQKGVQLMP